MYRIVWEYEVRLDQLAAFEALYGSAGAWAGLFHRASEYRGTQLFRDTERATHFLTIDSWQSQAGYDAFLASVHAEYVRLDEQGAALLTSERCLGTLGP